LAAVLRPGPLPPEVVAPPLEPDFAKATFFEGNPPGLGGRDAVKVALGGLSELRLFGSGELSDVIDDFDPCLPSCFLLPRAGGLPPDGLGVFPRASLPLDDLPRFP